MPPRVHRTPEQALAQEDVRREQNRLAKQRSRARQRDAARVPVTGQQDGAAREGASVSMTDRLPSSREVTFPEEKGVPPGVAAALAPLADRGFVYDPATWLRMAARYPAADLEFEAEKMAEWASDPKQAKRRISRMKQFVDNWFKGGDARRQATPPPASARPPATVRGVALPNGQWAPPASWQRQPEPEGLVRSPGPMQHIDPTKARREIEALRATPYPERLAQARNGRHG